MKFKISSYYTIEYGTIYQLSLEKNGNIKTLNIHNLLNMYVHDYWQLCKKHNWIQLNGNIYHTENDIENLIVDLMPYLYAANVAKKLIS